MRIIMTTSDNEISVTRESTSGFAPDIGQRELNVLNIYPSERFQTFIGFGGAVTDSAGWVYAQLPGERRREFIEMCYGPAGLAYTLGRTHIDSCDFSTEMYCADGDESDDSLGHFDMGRCGKYVFPLLDDIMRERRELRLVLAPWSPPAYMKDNASRTGGGHLKSEYRGRWARYICRYAAELERRGYKIFALSAQNEPNAVQTWDSCLYSPADERDFIRGYLSPELRAAGLDGVKIIVWDHNKERLFDRVDEICSDPGANAAVGAAGFHWYSGDHFDALRLVRRKYPDKLLIFTEGCIEYSRGSRSAQIKNAQRYAREILYGINAGLNAFIDWNILLDSRGGPNHVGNFCDSPVMADLEAGQLMYNLSYQYIRHFSRYIAPGAVRLGTTTWDEGLGFCALFNTDGSVTAVLLNTTGSDCECFVRVKDRIAPAVSPANSIVTMLLSRGEVEW